MTKHSDFKPSYCSAWPLFSLIVAVLRLRKRELLSSLTHCHSVTYLVISRSFLLRVALLVSLLLFCPALNHIRCKRLRDLAVCFSSSSRSLCICVCVLYPEPTFMSSS